MNTIRRRHRCLAYQNLEPRRLLATLFSETFEAFDGSGFASSPTAGQLDSDQWRVTGLSEGAGVFGGNHTTGDFARGLANIPVSSGGVYAFDVGGNRAFGTQPTGSDMTPGSFDLQLANTTGSAVNQWTISYDVWFDNNENRGNSIKLSYSTDDTSYTSVTAVDFTSPELSDSAGWSNNAFETTIDVTVADGGQLFFRWTFADESGSGSRDELGLDDIVVSTNAGNGVGGLQSLDLRIVSYNIANSPQNSGNDGPFSTIFSAIGQETMVGVTRDVDLLVLQETDPTSIARLESILDGLYSQNYSRVISNNFSGDFFGYIYNTETLTLLETENVSGNYTRDPFRALFQPVGSTAGSANFHVFNVHLNATNAATRATEASGIRAELDALGSTENAFVIGDLNIDGSSETSYATLTGSGTGQVFDPINSPGNWHNNGSFKAIHTQNPAGPMDDRFDFQLINDDVLAAGGLEFIPGSYRAFGNDGSHNLDQAITTGSGATGSVLSALANASDHLPVVVDYSYQIASVATASLFYEDSRFDDSSDLDAATGKIPLLPGATATFENYSSYDKGINGMLLEVNELPTVPSLANVNQFFQFRRGNNNDVASWSSAAAPVDVAYQSNVDSVGTDRIFLTWAEQVIKNTWLEVTVLANSTTGLVEPVVYYFGNAVGETGNESSNAKVDLVDLAFTRANQTGFGNAAIDNQYDFNRDGRVNPLDLAIVRANQSGFSPLILITPGSSGKSAGGGSGFVPLSGLGLNSRFELGGALPTQPEWNLTRKQKRAETSHSFFSKSNMETKNELSDHLATRDKTIEGYLAPEPEFESRPRKSNIADQKNNLLDSLFTSLGAWTEPIA